VFNPIRVLTAEEADMVLEHRNDPRIDRILAEDMPVVAAPAEPVTPGVTFEQPPAVPVAAPVQVAAPVAAAPAAQEPKPARKPRAAAPVAPAPVVAPPVQAAPTAPTGLTVEADDDFDAALDAELEGLMGK
jgi:hypothetical protein